jgi:hypothetical protein
MKKIKPLSWKPRNYQKDGHRYCSPACGHDCTAEEHQQAQRNADGMARALGAGWKGVVWENLGWHYRATKGSAEVYCHGPRAHWCSFMIGGHQYQGKGRTPKAALNRAREAAFQHGVEIELALEIVS